MKESGFFIDNQGISKLGLDLETKKFEEFNEPRNTKLFSKILLDFLSSNGMTISTDVPKNCIHLHHRKNFSSFVIMDEPRFHSIKVRANSQGFKNMESIYKIKNPKHVNKELDSDGNYDFYLYFPYVYYNLLFRDNYLQRMEVYMHYKSIKSILESLYHLPMMNIQLLDDRKVSSVCLGNISDIDYQNTSINEIINSLILRFWSASFNDEFTDALNLFSNTIFSNYFVWEEISKNKPITILNPLEYENINHIAQIYFNQSITENNAVAPEIINFYEILSHWLGEKSEDMQSIKNIFGYQKAYRTNWKNHMTLISTELNYRMDFIVGSKIEFNNESYQIDDFFINYVNGNAIPMVALSNDKKVISLKETYLEDYANEICLNYLKDQNKLLSKCVLPDGTILKTRDIIEYQWGKENHKYSSMLQVNKIFRSVLTDEIYLLSNTRTRFKFVPERIKLYNMENLKYKIGDKISFIYPYRGFYYWKKQTIKYIEFTNDSMFVFLLDNGFQIRFIIKNDKILFHEPNFIIVENQDKPQPIDDLNFFISNSKKYINYVEKPFIYNEIVVSFDDDPDFNMFHCSELKNDITLQKQIVDNLIKERNGKLTFSCMVNETRYDLSVGDQLLISENKLAVVSSFEFDVDSVTHSIKAILKFSDGKETSITLISFRSYFDIFFSHFYKVIDHEYFKTDDILLKTSSSIIKGIRKNVRYKIKAVIQNMHDKEDINVLMDDNRIFTLSLINRHFSKEMEGN